VVLGGMVLSQAVTPRFCGKPVHALKNDVFVTITRGHGTAQAGAAHGLCQISTHASHEGTWRNGAIVLW
jgi:hypothetical protein